MTINEIANFNIPLRAFKEGKSKELDRIQSRTQPLGSLIYNLSFRMMKAEAAVLRAACSLQWSDCATPQKYLPTLSSETRHITCFPDLLDNRYLHHDADVQLCNCFASATCSIGAAAVQVTPVNPLLLFVALRLTGLMALMDDVQSEGLQNTRAADWFRTSLTT